MANDTLRTSGLPLLWALSVAALLPRLAQAGAKTKLGEPWPIPQGAEAEHPQAAREAPKLDWLDVAEALPGHEKQIVGHVPKELEASWHHTGIVTFAAMNSTQAVDAAVMLGLSLQRYVPEFFRMCVVLNLMSQIQKLLLANAGWVLVEVPGDDPVAQAHGDINIFRVRFRRLVYFSPNFFLRNSDLYGLLEKYWLPLGQLGMVRNSGPEEGFEGGMMVFRPNLNDFKRLRAFALAHPRSSLPEAVREQLGHRIVNLQARWNVHGRSSPKLCHEAVLAHFTGSQLPTVADVDTLRQLQLGNVHDGSSLNCTNLVTEYFQELKENAHFLSPQLRAALTEMDSELQFAGTGSSPLPPSRSLQLWPLLQPAPVQTSGARDCLSNRLCLATQAHLACIVLSLLLWQVLQLQQ